MGKINFEFDENKDGNELELINNRHKMWGMLDDIYNYAYQMKWETRGAIPVNEVREKIFELLDFFERYLRY